MCSTPKGQSNSRPVRPTPVPSLSTEHMRLIAVRSELALQRRAQHSRLGTIKSPTNVLARQQRQTQAKESFWRTVLALFKSPTGGAIHNLGNPKSK